ncbi:hypothetical protein GCM10009668_18670 [Nocardioides dubius]|uniref:DUF946 domain-containing protein n=1 Tax=Nocardioides dubius TaxID=317019 RepID=A0ABN1TSG4_9ACTN
MRRALRAAGAAAVLALVAVPVSGGSAAADDETPPATASAAPASPEAALAEKFAPVMSLVEQTEECGPGEPYVPSDVDIMFDNPSVALRGPWTQRDLVKAGPSQDDVAQGLPGYALDLPGDPLDPQCSYEKWANAQWGKEPTPTIYGRVAFQEGHEGRLALQYFFFYPFNDYNNKHETDWERIQLEFEADSAEEALGLTPVRAVYSQHYGSEYATWGESPDEKLEIVDDTHPVVFVSAGSHANQFSSGVFMGNNAELGFGCDTTAGDQRELRPVVKTIPTDDEEAAEAFPWTQYRGHWGEVGPRRFYEGPTGPNRKQAWNRPFSWSEKARASSFEVPGAGLVGSRVTETYCSAVGTGSDLFRTYVSSPLSVLLGLGVALLAMRWLLGRTRWETTPLPLRRWRSAGQTANASWQLFRAHMGLFLKISAPMAAITVASVAARSLGFVSGMPWWWQALLAVAALGSLLPAAAATVHAIGAIAEGRPVTVAEAYRGSWRPALAALVPLVVAGVVIVGCLGSLLLTPIALLLLTGWTLLLPLVVLDGVSGFRAWWRSLALAWRSWRTILPVAVFALLLLTTAGLVIAALLFLIYPAPFVILNAVPPLMVALLWPLVMIASTYCLATAQAAEQAANTPTTEATAATEEAAGQQA